MTTKIKMLKSADVAYMVERAVKAQDHFEAMDTNTNEAAHRLQSVLGEKPNPVELKQARDSFKEAFVSHYAKADADMGAPHMRSEVRVLKNGSKTIEVATEQYKARKAQASTRWSRMLKALGWKEEKEGESRGRKATVHKCPHCEGGFTFVKGKVEASSE